MLYLYVHPFFFGKKRMMQINFLVDCEDFDLNLTSTEFWNRIHECLTCLPGIIEHPYISFIKEAISSILYLDKLGLHRSDAVLRLESVSRAQAAAIKLYVFGEHICLVKIFGHQIRHHHNRMLNDCRLCVYWANTLCYFA